MNKGLVGLKDRIQALCEEETATGSYQIAIFLCLFHWLYLHFNEKHCTHSVLLLLQQCTVMDPEKIETRKDLIQKRDWGT